MILFILVLLALSGTQPIKFSQYWSKSALDRKKIAKLYLAIWETIGTLFLYFEVKTAILVTFFSSTFFLYKKSLSLRDMWSVKFNLIKYYVRIFTEPFSYHT